ncbi:MAG: GAF domain-containing protein [Chloroflexota bacterium]
MVLLLVIPDLPDFYAVFIDGLLLILVSFPILVFFYLRPMLAQIALQQESERRFRAVFEQTFQFMCLLNPDGTILQANESAVLAGELGQTNLQGQYFWEAFASTIPDPTKIQIEQAIQAAAKGQLVRFEEVFGPRENGYITVDVSVKPIMDEAGEIILIILEGRDVTHHKQIEQELRTEIGTREEKEAQIQKSALQAIALTEIMSTLQEVKDSYRPFLQVTAQKTAELLGDGCVIYVLDETQTQLKTAAFHHTDPATHQQLAESVQTDIDLEQSELFAQLSITQTPIFPLASEVQQLPQSFPAAYQTFFDTYSPTSFLALPIQIQNQLIGALLLFRNQTDVPYTFDEIDFAQDIALKAGLAVKNVRLFLAEQKSRQTGETLSTAALTLTRTLKLEYIFSRLLDYLVRLIPFDAACLALLENETRLAVRATRNTSKITLSDNYFAQLLADSSNPLIENALANQSSYLIHDAPQAGAGTLAMPAGYPHMASWLIVPIVTNSKVIGLCLLTAVQAETFNREHQQWAEAMLSQAAVAIQNAWLFEQIRVGRERLQSLSRRLVDVQEAERRYIARELHDEVGQALASLMVGLRLMERDAEKPEFVVNGIVKLKQVVDEVLENLHRLAMHLRPATLDHLGLIPALQQYIDDLNERGGLAVQFETFGVEMRLESEVETVLYRIVQEALTNVIKHAQATQVGVLIERREERLVAIVEDDGIGFDVTHPLREGHLGLFGIRERLDMFGGTLHLESAPGMGTTLFAEVPYDV